MDKDFLKEKIGYYKTIVPLLWTGVFLTNGGIGWLVNNKFPCKIFTITSFILVSFSLIIGLFFLDKRIRKLLKELKNV
ncbi:MAG TPA: hypothetical protein DDW90_07560 [Cyanobacteria bacterium UBA9971]|nr:hypothetical protein [Cyanobacteria bacterium UBA9971]